MLCASLPASYAFLGIPDVWWRVDPSPKCPPARSDGVPPVRVSVCSISRAQWSYRDRGPLNSKYILILTNHIFNNHLFK